MSVFCMVVVSRWSSAPVWPSQQPVMSSQSQCSHLTVSQRPTAMPHPGTRFSLQQEIQKLSTHRSTTRSGVTKVPLGRCITHWIPSSLSSFQMTIALSLTCTSCTPATSCLWWSSQCSAMQSSRAGLAKFDRTTQISVQKRWPCLRDKWDMNIWTEAYRKGKWENYMLPTEPKRRVQKNKKLCECITLQCWVTPTKDF